MLQLLYPLLKGFIVFLIMIVVIAMAARVIFDYADPNPFGFFGKMASKLRRYTRRAVDPISMFLSGMRVDSRFAPAIIILLSCVVGYFILQLFFNIFFTIDGVFGSIQTRSVTRIVGFLMYGILGVYSLAIVSRIILSWVVGYGNSVLRFLVRITDPVLAPFRRLIPPIGMFDISPIVVLFVLNIFQAAVFGVLIN